MTGSTRDPFNLPATLFKGPDVEILSIRRDSLHFERLSDAILHAVEQLATAEKYGCYIESDRVYRWPEIERLYSDMKPTQSGP